MSNLMRKLESFKLERVDCCGKREKISLFKSLFIRLFYNDKIISEWPEAEGPMKRKD